jgi:GH43 family beta-xylosidase
MKKITKKPVKFIAICIAMLIFQIGNSQSFTNPVGDLADPHITFIDGFYYYTGTVGNRIAIKRATTLEGLKHSELTTIFRPGDLNAQADHFWNSEVHKLDGKWYVYYTAASTGTDNSTQRNYVIECPDPNPLIGTWTFKGQLLDGSANYFTTNPTISKINGALYFLWAGASTSGTSPLNIYISAMTNPWTLSGSRAAIYTSGDLAGTVNGEAPSVLVKDGKVFLTYTANGCGSSDGKTGLMYMVDDTNNPLLVGSWIKVDLPVFDDNSAVSSYNPNHQTFFKSPDNTEYWFSFTSRFDDGPWCDNQRSTRAQKLTFDSDGIPEFGTISAIGTPIIAPSGESLLPAGAVVQNGLYRIKPKAASGTQSLEIGGINIWGGANVGQWFDDTNEVHYKWYLQATNVPDEYVITSAFNGLVIEVGACDENNLANINMWYPTGAPCQIWKITDLGSGDYRLTSKNSGKVIELENGGNNIYQNTLDVNSDFQKFKLELIDSALDVSMVNLPNDFKVFPNPAGEYFTIKGLIGYQMTITDLLGKRILGQEIKTEEFKIDSSKLKSGMYIISISGSNNENVMTKKLIIK